MRYYSHNMMYKDLLTFSTQQYCQGCMYLLLYKAAASLCVSVCLYPLFRHDHRVVTNLARRYNVDKSSHFDILTTNLAAVVCVCVCVSVCAKFDQFLPERSHFDSKRPKIFVRIATFPSATFGPLFLFHCPLFVTKNNNLEWQSSRSRSPLCGR